MGGRVTFANWFLWSYVALFALLTALAAWWAVDLARRPEDRFPAGWPAPKLRWGLVPWAWLAVIAIQTAMPNLERAALAEAQRLHARLVSETDPMARPEIALEIRMTLYRSAGRPWCCS